MTNEEMETQLPKLRERITYDEDIFGNTNVWENILKQLLEDSKFIALEVLYPYQDYSEFPLPKKYYNWQIRCCVELYNLADKQGFTNYTENSLSFTKLSDGLSNFLMNSLIPNVGIPKSSESEE